MQKTNILASNKKTRLKNEVVGDVILAVLPLINWVELLYKSLGIVELGLKNGCNVV